MILETLTYCLTPCKREYKLLGALSESIAIPPRYRRNEQAWSGHLGQSRCFIKHAASGCKQHRHAVILGAGHVFDIPIRELCESFERITLVDLVFLPLMRMKFFRRDQIELLEADVSGVIVPLVNDKRLPQPSIKIPGIRPDTDFIVSTNMLSQIPLLPGQYAAEQLSRSEDEIQQWQKLLVQNHLDALTNHPACKCILTDTIRIRIHGQETTTEDCLFGVTLPSTSESWTWHVAPKGEIAADISVSTKVAACIIEGIN